MRRSPLIPLLLLLLALLAAPTAAGAQTEGAGSISGVVTAPAGEPMPTGLEVELLFLPNGQGPPQIRSQPLASNGAFLFDGVDTNTSHRYLVRVTVEGEENFSDLIAFGPGQSSQQVMVQLLARTTDASALTLPAASAILDARPEGWAVVVLYRFVNEGERVIVNLTDPPAVIPLPEGAHSLRFADESLGTGVVELPNGFAYTGPFPPGELPLAFSFTLPYREGTDELVLPFLPAATPLRVLVPQIGEQRESPSLRFVGEQEVSGAGFDEFEGAAGTTEARLRFQGLPPLPTDTPGLPNGQPLVLPISPLERTPWWFPLLPVALTVGALLIYLWRRPAATPGERRVVRQARRERLVTELAHLENRFDGGEIGEQAFRLQRAALRQELRALLSGPNGSPEYD